MGTFFSDTFGIDPKQLDDYGAFDVSVVNDLPLFVDPFLLFHSEKPEYQELHNSIIDYLVFLRDRAGGGLVGEGLLKSWYCFKEVKQNWLGFSRVGNSGSGLGIDFARALHTNLGALLRGFGEEKITLGSHLEKVCLISDGVGRDNISDFVTNLIKDYLCRFTERFADQFLDDKQVRKVSVERAVFDYQTQSWVRKTYRLPYYVDDYIILTPKDMLTRDETWISRADMINQFDQIPTSIGDRELRETVDNYFQLALRRYARPRKPPTAKERREAATDTIRNFPQLIDYYIRLKEVTGDEAVSVSADRVFRTELFFSQRMREILHPQLLQTDFYTTAGGTYAEAHLRLAFLKDVIEDQGGWRIFYDRDGKPVEREADIQVLFRLVWLGTPSDFGSEANDGRGPVDFKISRGRHKTLVEMKLAKNTQLEANLSKQLEIYQISANAEKGIKAIVYYSLEQFKRVTNILKRIGLDDSPDVVLIDARSDNKPSASKVK